MSLTAAELTQLMGVLEKLDQGSVQPRIGGRIGRFLRQYGGSRAELDQVLAEHEVERRADGAVSGRSLGAVEVHPLLQPEVRLLGVPLEEVAETLAISEEVGGLVALVMWLKGRVATSAHNLLRTHLVLRLSGDYRWTPPARLTPGEAHLETSGRLVQWQNARCLKAVAEDLIRPPHALEYLLDYRLGPPGLKFFRCVCALRRAEEWQVLPGLGRSTSLELSGVLSEVLSDLSGVDLATLLIYREPWAHSWTIVRGAPVDAEGALAHAITWADFQREVDGTSFDPQIIEDIRNALRACGLRTAASGEPSLARSLLPVARTVLRWLHGVGLNRARPPTRLRR